MLKSFAGRKEVEIWVPSWLYVPEQFNFSDPMLVHIPENIWLAS